MDRKFDLIPSKSPKTDADPSGIKDFDGIATNPTEISFNDEICEYDINTHSEISMALTQPEPQTQSESGADEKNDSPPAAVVGSVRSDTKPIFINSVADSERHDATLVGPSTSGIESRNQTKSLIAPPVLKWPNVEVDSFVAKQRSSISECQILKGTTSPDCNWSTKYREIGGTRYRSTTCVPQSNEQIFGSDKQSLASTSSSSHSIKKDQILNITSPTNMNPMYKKANISELYGKFEPKQDVDKTSAVTNSTDEKNNEDSQTFTTFIQELREVLPSVPVTPQTSKADDIQKLLTDSKLNEDSNEINEPLENEIVTNANEKIEEKVVKDQVVEEYAGEEQLNEKEADEKEVEEEEEDGYYFLKVLKTERDRLLDLAATADKHIQTISGCPGIPEDTFGLLRAASGKARLLATKKMKQFESLCDSNINATPTDKYAPTVGDLQGFWDMVLIQVEDINLMFAEIEEIKNNNWRKKRIPHTAPSRTAAKKHQKLPASGNAKAKTVSTSGNTNNASGSSSASTSTRPSTSNRPSTSTRPSTLSSSRKRKYPSEPQRTNEEVSKENKPNVAKAGKNLSKSGGSSKGKSGDK